MNKTLEYYNENSNDYFEITVSYNMNAQYSMFEKRLYAGTKILDCGCGSGRDTKYFIDQGYEVTAIDGSEELCKRASELTGIEAKIMLFQDIEYVNEFDGVWACASLLHVPKTELLSVIKRITRALKNCGIFYVSFKYGEYKGEKNGRFFTDLNEDSFEKIISEVPELVIQY